MQDRSKRQLWTYSGLGIETHDTAQYGYGGQLQRTKKPQQISGLNQNHMRLVRLSFIVVFSVLSRWNLANR